MDVQPAHLNRDSFRDSFKRLVSLEIIIDLPLSFPNKQHYLSATMRHRGVVMMITFIITLGEIM